MANKSTKDDQRAPVPHDLRNEPLPTGDPQPSRDPIEESEGEDSDDGTSPKERNALPDPQDPGKPKGLREEDVLITDEDVLPTGIQTGQTARGSYSTDTSTGAGRYGDHRSGTFGVDGVAQPGNDEEVEPDPIDPQF